MARKTVDEYIDSLDERQAEIAARVRSIIKGAAPEAAEAFKWSQPVYELNGPFCYMKAFKNSLNLGFWRGIDLKDPHGLLQGTGAKMRHVKLTSSDDIAEQAFTDFVRQAVQLNLVKGDPTKRN
jgi:hypothetical protein